MNKLFRKIKISRNTVYFGLFLFAIAIILGWPQTAKAGVLDLGLNVLKTLAASPILMAIGVIAVLVTVLFGALNSLIIGALISITKYNNFINESSIRDAWVIVRDLSNMFFILILLVIAFATILRIESYQWKKLLPKLLIMAVLINFSRTICGLIIDASQVIMLTFVNAWPGSGSGFVVMTKMTTYFTGIAQTEWDKFTSADYSVLNIVVGMLVGIMFLIISGIVLLVALVVFIMRVIMLWIYIVLSPLAFILAAFPAGQKYAAQWWSEFTKYVVSGPILAFFIWLALIVSDQVTKTSSIVFNSDQCFGLTQGMCLNNFLPFIISIGMLVGGLMITQQVGGAIGSVAGKGLDWAKKAGNVPLRVGRYAGKYGALKAGRSLDTLQMKAQKGIAGLLGIKEDVYKPKSLNYRVIAAAWKAKKDKDMEKYETQHGGLTNVWHDNFNKYARLGQYGALRKSRNQQARDEEAAGKLDHESKMLYERKENIALTEPEKTEKLTEMEKLKANRINAYKSKGFSQTEAEKEFKKDSASLENEANYIAVAGENFSDIDQHIKNNEQQAKELRDKRVSVFGRRVGFKGMIQAEPQYSKAGSKEILEKKTKEMEQRTEAKDFAVVGELIKAYEEKDQQNIAAAFRILAKNNDLNEALKDSRLMNLMTQDNGVLEKLANSMQGEEKKALNDNMDAIKKNMRANPVTPANVQAMIQGMFAASDMEKSMAARYTSDIGTVSFGAGNSVIFGAAKGNANTGNFTFNELKVDEKGSLVSNDDRIGAIIGKFANLGTQEKIRTLHPDVIIKEAPDGSGAGIHGEGKAFLKSLTTNDLGQLNRLRLDVIRKVGGSKAALKDAKILVEELIATGEEANIQQAEVIKSFIGYCKNSFEGKGTDMDKLKDARAAFDTI